MGGNRVTAKTGDDRSNALRLAGTAGVLGIALGLAGVLIDQMETFPGTGSTARDIAEFVQAHRTALLVAMLLNTAALSLWLVFGAGVWLWLRETTGVESIFSACFMLGLLGFVALLFAGFAAFFVLVYRGADASEPKLLYDLALGLLAMSGAPTALALGSYAAATHRAAHIPRWTAALAALAALAHVALFASFLIRSGFFSLEGGVIIAIPGTLFAWILGTSLAMKAAARSAAPINPPA
jgi:hypothetical protein